MRTETSTEGVVRRWYQRTWLWLVVASLALPLSVGFLILGVMVLDRNWVVASIGSLSMALVPFGMWMAALVAKHAWTRAVLAIATTLLIVVAFFSLYSYGNGLEEEAFGGCEFIPTADGGVVQRDAELCEYVANGSLERDENLRFLVLGVTWVAPLVALYAFRGRLRPDHQPGSKWGLEVLGWMAITLGGLFAAIALSVGIGDQSGDAVLAAAYVVLPIAVGVLLIRIGRRTRRRNTPADNAPS